MAMTQQREDDLVGALDALFHPRAIAIIGASGRAGNPFARPLEYLVGYGFEGSVFPINPGYDLLEGVPCYSTLADVPERIDLVLMMVPAKVAIDVMPEVANAGARAAVVFASGFGETGEEGERLQQELASAARAHGVRLIGPNCQGVLSTTSKMFGTFTAALENGPIASGSLAYVGQSGAVGGSILSLANERGIGISSWVSTGNQADLDSVTVGRYLIDQEDTSVLAMYLESTTDERDFLDLAERAAVLGKPLIVLRSAVSAAGARAAASHTGAIVGDAAAFHATVAEYGIIEAHDINELIDYAHANTALTSMCGPHVGVVTTSGGAGSLAADLLDGVGLLVEEFARESQVALAEVVPNFGAVENPVDVTAQIFRAGKADEFIDVCRRVANLDEVDGLMIAITLVTGDFATSTAAAIADLVAVSKKPIVVAWAASHEQTAGARAHFRSVGLPVYDSVGAAARSLATLRSGPTREAIASTPSWGPYVSAIVDEMDALVTESRGRELLTLAGVPHPLAFLVTSREEAEEVAVEFTDPVVIKIQSEHVLHKSDVGGVLVGVQPDQIADTVVGMRERFADVQVEGVLVQEMAPVGREFILGVTTSEGGLPLITVGMGGTATELYRDTATTFAPVDVKRARELILQTRSSALLTGFRGEPVHDIEGMAQVVSSVSQLAVAIGPRLRELEINPLRISHDRERPIMALDFLMRLSTKENN